MRVVTPCHSRPVETSATIEPLPVTPYHALHLFIAIIIFCVRHISQRPSPYGDYPLSGTTDAPIGAINVADVP